ncbi:DJ-1/PfpI family protein [Sphingobium amiense]|nr:DJ-1/PfpI family protein [Sphingobium amiense]
MVAARPAAAQISASPPTVPAGPKLRLGMVLFDDFEVLDVYGPLSMFGALKDRVQITTIAEKAGTITTASGLSFVADVAFADAPQLDLVIIPGGMGTRREVNNAQFLSAIRHLAEVTPQVATVCTGAAVLAKTGWLDGKRATSNKMAWKWVTAQSAKVLWVPKARWVEDGKVTSSSGVSAGMDMALFLIAKRFGKETATWVANRAEYRWYDNPADDPYAAMNGLGA